MSIYSYVIKLFIRGGFKLGLLILISSIFIAIPISTSLLANGYVSSLKSVVKSPTSIYCYGSSYWNGSIEVRYSSIEVDGESVTIVVKPSRFNDWLSFHKARIKKIGSGSIYIGSKIYSDEHVKSFLYKIFNKSSIGYVVSGDGYIGWSVVVPNHIADTLNLDWKTVYEGRCIESKDIISVPSMKYLPEAGDRGLSNLIYWFSILLYSLLAVGIPPITFMLYRGSRDYRMYITSLKRSSKVDYLKVNTVITLIASSSSTFLGFSVGLIMSHILSFIIHRIFLTPFIEPSIEHTIFNIILIGFILSTVSIFTSLNILAYREDIEYG